MDWIKVFYEAVGIRYPVLSLVGVSLLGAILFGIAWWAYGKHYEKEHSAISSEPASGLPSARPASDSATTSNSTRPLPPDDKAVTESVPDATPKARQETKESQVRPKESPTQIMNNSPGGIQAGGDVNQR